MSLDGHVVAELVAHDRGHVGTVLVAHDRVLLIPKWLPNIMIFYSIMNSFVNKAKFYFSKKT